MDAPVQQQKSIEISDGRPEPRPETMDVSVPGLFVRLADLQKEDSELLCHFHRAGLEAAGSGHDAQEGFVFGERGPDVLKDAVEGRDELHAEGFAVVFAFHGGETLWGRGFGAFCGFWD